MRSSFGVKAGLAVTACLFSSVDAVSKVTRGGRYLYNSDGSRFYIKGVAYQPQGMSVLSE